MSKAAGKKRGEGRSRVYEMLLQEILSLRLEPGSSLDEAELAQAFGVSRTPMREAIIALAGDGLVQLRPNRSARVAPMDVHNLREYHEASELMHRVVARWAAARRSADDLALIVERQHALELASTSEEPFAMVRANVDFHAAIALAAHNRHVADQYGRLLKEGQRLSNISLSTQHGSTEERRTNVERVIREHRAIIDAIRDQDEERSDLLAAQHAQYGRERLMHYLSNSGSTGIRL